MKQALILGGNSDMGRAIASKFARNGWSIVLAGRNKEYLDRIASDIRIRTDQDVRVSYFDAIDFRSHKLFYQNISPPPELCVCAFGYLGSQDVAQLEWNETERIIDVNFKGTVSILNIVAEDFAQRKKGVIIGISSVAGDRGRQGNYIYGSAKAGLTAYLSGLRNSLYRKGVHVITVKPGFVKTKMTQHLNLPPLLTTEPENVAKAVYTAYLKKQHVVYILKVWKYIMKAIGLIPEWLFKKTRL